MSSLDTSRKIEISDINQVELDIKRQVMKQSELPSIKVKRDLNKSYGQIDKQSKVRKSKPEISKNDYSLNDLLKLGYLTNKTLNASPNIVKESEGVGYSNLSMSKSRKVN